MLSGTDFIHLLLRKRRVPKSTSSLLYYLTFREIFYTSRFLWGRYNDNTNTGKSNVFDPKTPYSRRTYKFLKKFSNLVVQTLHYMKKQPERKTE